MRQGLADAVNLIIMAAMRKRKQFALKIRKPSRILWEKHLATGEFTAFDRHPGYLAAFRLDRDRGKPRTLQFLGQGRADPAILHQKRARLVQPRMGDAHVSQTRVVKPP